jgi:hypothetical protein
VRRQTACAHWSLPTEPQTVCRAGNAFTVEPRPVRSLPCHDPPGFAGPRGGRDTLDQLRRLSYSGSGESDGPRSLPRRRAGVEHIGSSLFVADPLVKPFGRVGEELGRCCRRSRRHTVRSRVEPVGCPYAPTDTSSLQPPGAVEPRQKSEPVSERRGWRRCPAEKSENVRRQSFPNSSCHRVNRGWSESQTGACNDHLCVPNDAGIPPWVDKSATT